MKIILGIDPALNNTGWGIIGSDGSRIKYFGCGVIKNKTNIDIADKLLNINESLNEVIANYKPDFVALEETFVTKNGSSTLKLGHARGAIMLTSAIAGLPIYEYSATKVKKTITGVGRAEKEQMQMMVKQILPLADVSQHDAADALAIAICHVHHYKITSLTS